MLALAMVGSGAALARPADEATQAGRIREAAIAQVVPGASYPLPLAAHWNTGHVAGGFDPDHQLHLFREGHYLLPWFELPRPDRSLPDAYFGPALEHWARLGMPISFISTQWDVLVAEALQGAARPHADGGTTRPPPLAPDSPLEAWYAAGRRWGSSPLLARLQEAYPTPPLVLFVSNNEQLRLSWMEARRAGIVLEGAAPGTDDDGWRRAVGDAWARRYQALIRGFRDGLASPHWRDRARFVGYEAFGQPAMGRWGGWAEYSLHAAGRFEPWSAAWDGASVSYYTGDWNPSSDFRVWSPQVESMNLVPMLEQARRDKPQFWLELSTWDGRSDELERDKEHFYRALGQRWDVARYSGMVQFGLWLLRPRLVREFRDTLSFRDRYGRDFAVVLAAVARVHEDPLLARFWRHGRLVGNPRDGHPYQEAIPPALRSRPRWFLLEAEGNPPRPWTLETELPLFSMALELGQAPRREWLVYAHAPQAGRLERRVTIVDGVRPRVLATRAGCFNHVSETAGLLEQRGC